jgi:hypothetical protein
MDHRDWPGGLSCPLDVFPAMMVREREGRWMFTIPYNTTLFIVGAIVVAIIGFVIYGLIKGFENIFRND